MGQGEFVKFTRSLCAWKAPLLRPFSDAYHLEEHSEGRSSGILRVCQVHTSCHISFGQSHDCSFERRRLKEQPQKYGNYILWLPVITSSTEKDRVSGGMAYSGYRTKRDNGQREIQVYIPVLFSPQE